MLIQWRNNTSGRWILEEMEDLCGSQQKGLVLVGRRWEREPLTAAGMVTLISTLDPIYTSELCGTSASKRGRQLTDAHRAGPR